MIRAALLMLTHDHPSIGTDDSASNPKVHVRLKGFTISVPSSMQEPQIQPRLADEIGVLEMYW